MRRGYENKHFFLTFEDCEKCECFSHYLLKIFTFYYLDIISKTKILESVYKVEQDQSVNEVHYTQNYFIRFLKRF